ncbi:MAG: twin-arginine translocation signal domain-containing protein [Gemmatimonadaceae bacterium]
MHRRDFVQRAATLAGAAAIVGFNPSALAKPVDRSATKTPFPHPPSPFPPNSLLTNPAPC